MPQTFGDRLRHAWNAFTNKDPTYRSAGMGESFSSRQDRTRLTRGNERSIINSVYNRIAMDVASLKINHVRLDANDRFSEIITSGLNTCLTLDANVDQTGRAFMQDAVLSLLDEGSVAIVPVDTTFNPTRTGSYEIESLRVGRVVE